jgi:thymidylate synthase
MVEDILKNGVEVENTRTGTKTKALFDYKLTIKEDEFPFSTVRPAGPRLAFEEMWFFLNGKTDTTELEQKGCFFWVGNTRREFLDGIGLYHEPEGSLGVAYSEQFRNFGGTAGPVGIDQVRETYETLKQDPYSRRVYNVIWNPAENHLGCITPCWLSHQFVALPSGDENVLHLKVTNRSLDSVFGCQFAVMQYRMYQIALAKLLGMRVGKMSCDLTHVHIYENQYEYATELLEREFGYQLNGDWAHDSTRVSLNKTLTSLEDLLSIEWSDWDIEMPVVNTTKFKTPRPEMVA